MGLLRLRCGFGRRDNGVRNNEKSSLKKSGNGKMCSRETSLPCGYDVPVRKIEEVLIRILLKLNNGCRGASASQIRHVSQLANSQTATRRSISGTYKIDVDQLASSFRGILPLFSGFNLKEVDSVAG